MQTNYLCLSRKISAVESIEIHDGQMMQLTFFCPCHEAADFICPAKYEAPVFHGL